jgi:phosphoribosyl 1,2-cyclic phosphodiesterase
MRVKSLSSGSSGNCYLVQAGGHSLLIDCGLSATALQKFLALEGVNVAELSGIFLTHDHHDHLSGAGQVSRRWGIPIFANKKTIDEAAVRWAKIEKLYQQRASATKPPESRTYNTRLFPTGKATTIGSIEINSFPVSHDAAETVCYTFKADGVQAVILTDLGCSTPPIYEPLVQSRLVILEANHEEEKLWAGKYPYTLKKRVTGDKGHLSNRQSGEILRYCLENTGLAPTVWLAHLSSENNSPQEATATITKLLEEAGIARFPLNIALRDKPSLVYETEQYYYQASMF